MVARKLIRFNNQRQSARIWNPLLSKWSIYGSKYSMDGLPVLLLLLFAFFLLCDIGEGGSLGMIQYGKLLTCSELPY